MQYSEILSMLDAEIARLEKARELLLPLLPSSSPSRGLSEAPSPEAERSAAAEPEAAVENDAVEIKILRPRRSYGPRTKRTRAMAEAESALRTAVPAGPVAVSANDVRRLESQKVIAVPAPHRAAAPEPLAWRAEAEQARREDDLLQRFMEMGSERARSGDKLQSR